MTAYELPANTKAATGFTHLITVDHVDLTTTTAATAQTIDLLDLPVGTVVNKVAYKLVTPFKDISDAAYNDTDFSVGETGDVDEFIDETEVNENGTEISYSAGFTFTDASCTLPRVYTTASKLTATFAGMSAKSLSDLDAGKVEVYVSLTDLTAI